MKRNFVIPESQVEAIHPNFTVEVNSVVECSRKGGYYFVKKGEWVSYTSGTHDGVVCTENDSWYEWREAVKKVRNLHAEEVAEYTKRRLWLVDVGVILSATGNPTPKASLVGTLEEYGWNWVVPWEMFAPEVQDAVEKYRRRNRI